jgi:hypothetical protein
MNQQLPFSLHVRFTLDQRQLLEDAAKRHDTTLSGAVRHYLDQALDRPVNDQPDAPTLRELQHEGEGESLLPRSLTNRIRAEHAAS